MIKIDNLLVVSIYLITQCNEDVTMSPIYGKLLDYFYSTARFKSKINIIYTGQQKKRIFCIFSIVYKLGFEY